MEWKEKKKKKKQISAVAQSLEWIGGKNVYIYMLSSRNGVAGFYEKPVKMLTGLP